MGAVGQCGLRYVADVDQRGVRGGDGLLKWMPYGSDPKIASMRADGTNALLLLKVVHDRSIHVPVNIAAEPLAPMVLCHGHDEERPLLRCDLQC